MIQIKEFFQRNTGPGLAAGTLHIALYLPKIQSAWLALGGNRKPFIFNFSQWLKGTNTQVKQIKGELNANQDLLIWNI
jgi:hypothetical protein